MVGMFPVMKKTVGSRAAACSPSGQRSDVWEFSFEEVKEGPGDKPLVSAICTALEDKKRQLSGELEELRVAERSCRMALETLHHEELIWEEKLDSIKKKISEAGSKKKEATLMLKLHETLEKSASLSDTVRTVQGLLTEDIPIDMKAMVGDCFNVQHTANSGECVICTSSFTAEDLLSPTRSECCRHTLYPCGHSVICGMCAKHIWDTTQKCPLCRVQLTKKPKIFRPGRQQQSNKINA